MTTLLLAMLLNQALSPERQASPPSAEPIGSFVDGVTTPDGLFAMTVDPLFFTGYARIIARDGTRLPVVRNNSMFYVGTPIHTTRGIVSIIYQQARYKSQRFDPATAAPDGDPIDLHATAGVTNRVTAGFGGQVLWLTEEFIGDGGTAKSAWLLDSVGAPLPGSPRPLVVANGDSAQSASSNATGHWVAWRTATGGTVLDLIDNRGQQTQMLAIDEQPIEVKAGASVVALLSLSMTPVFEVKLRLIAMNGGVLRTVGLPPQCTASAVSVTDVALVACKTGVGDTPWRIAVHRVRFDGSVTSTTLDAAPVDSDVTPVKVLQDPKTILLRRTFLRPANPPFIYSAVSAVRLNDDLSLAGAPFDLFERPSRQATPSFASRERGEISALAFTDDRGRQDDRGIDVVRVWPDGGTGSKVTLPSGSGSVISSRRSLATDGTDFVALTSRNGSRIVPFVVRGDGGGVTEAAEIYDGGQGVTGHLIAGGTRDPYAFSWSSAQTTTLGGLNALGGLVASAAETPLEATDLLAHQRTLLGVFAQETTGLAVFSFLKPGAPTNLTLERAISTPTRATNGRLAHAGEVVLAAWEEQIDSNTVRVGTQFVTGGVETGVVSFDLPSSPFASPGVGSTLNDIGVRDGVFYVFGVTKGADAGSVLWVWARPADGGLADDRPTVFDEVSRVVEVAAGPQLDDGRLLFAYTRIDDTWPLTQVFLRSVGELPSHALGPDGGLEVYQLVGCAGCAAGSTSAWAWLAAVVVGFVARRAAKP